MPSRSISELKEDTSPQPEDFITTVKSPGGKGSNRKTTIASLRQGMGIEENADATNAVNIGTSINGVDNKNPPVDSDKVPIIDTEAANVLKTLTWANIKAFLKTYFDTLYRGATANHTHQASGAQAGKLDHGLALDGLGDDDHPQYIKHSLTTAENDFLVSSEAGVFVKKTLADTKVLIGSGIVVQVVNFQTGAVDTGTTVIPYDDTIPQKTEGDEYMTLAITPESADDILHIDVVVNLSSSTYGAFAAALFQDDNADALAVASSQGGTNQPLQLSFRCEMEAGTTDEIIFKVRAGNSTSATTTFNGVSGARKYGGKLVSSITITEIEV